MQDQDGSPVRSTPASPETGGRPLVLPRVRSPEKAARPVSEQNVFRRSNASLSALFASTTSASLKRASTPTIGTPATKEYAESVFSLSSLPAGAENATPNKALILRSFVPHVAVLPSPDVEELLAQKGLSGGLLQLLRPFGEKVNGKVTIRDSTGASKSWEDYAVRFVKPGDGLESPREAEDKASESRVQNINGVLDQYFPQSSQRLRSGGDVSLVEEAVEKHLEFAEGQSLAGLEEEEGTPTPIPDASSPFHQLYLRRLLSGLPLTPHETFSHPVACVVAASARNDDPIEELRRLNVSITTGEDRLPQWVSNDFMRYYVLIHDEDHDDAQKSMSIFQEMKRHFSLHCHLLRIRSSEAVPSDDGYQKLATCHWISAAEELEEIRKREFLDDIEESGAGIYESDATAVAVLVRELVTQSVVPLMERQCATWNDQIVSKRRGLSGRFLSLSKKWTPFGSSSRNSTSGSGNSGSNFDAQQGHYKADSPEALMRKLADYCFMLRDFKLAYSVYEMLRSDYSNDKAWKYYAGTHEMAALSSLMSGNPLITKSKSDSVDQMIETAVYSYITRCTAPFYALRLLAVAVELLQLRGGTSADDAARWCSRILDQDLVGPVGRALFAERASACFASAQGTGSKSWGSRNRRAGFWGVIACEAWLGLEKTKEAEKCLAQVFQLYHVTMKDPDALEFDKMRAFLLDLGDLVEARKGEDLVLEQQLYQRADEDSEAEAEGIEEATETLDTKKTNRVSFIAPLPNALADDAKEPLNSDKPDIRPHRKSLIGISTAPTIPLPSGARDAPATDPKR